MPDLISLDDVTEEIHISEWQLADLLQKYGQAGLERLEQQAIEKGLIIYQVYHDRSIRIRPKRELFPSPNAVKEIN